MDTDLFTSLANAMPVLLASRAYPVLRIKLTACPRIVGDECQMRTAEMVSNHASRLLANQPGSAGQRFEVSASVRRSTKKNHLVVALRPSLTAFWVKTMLELSTPWSLAQSLRRETPVVAILFVVPCK